MAAKLVNRAFLLLLVLVSTHLTITDFVVGLGPDASPTPSAVPGVSPGPDFSPPSPFAPGSRGFAPSPGPDEQAPPDNEPPAPPTIVTWCAVPQETSGALNCSYLVSLLSPDDGSQWNCVEKNSKLDCLEAVKMGGADVVALDAGLAYVALMNYSMKSLMAEEYCYHQQTYDALMVVNKQMCDKNPNLSIRDFRGLKSCHAGYQFAGSWNYAVNYLLSAKLESIPSSPQQFNDVKVITSFFSATCAPSDNDNGICTACNFSASGAVACDSSSGYAGYAGAFKCLTEKQGDIAFLRSGIAQLYSEDGFLPQDWSKKPLSDFMYLCPTGGCRPINDDRSTCTLGSVAANTIMVSNSIDLSKKNIIQETLMYKVRNWIPALFSGTNAHDCLLTASAEGLAEVDQLTKSFLGLSANVSRNIQLLNANLLQASDLEYISSESPGRASTSIIFLLFTTALAFWFGG